MRGFLGLVAVVIVAGLAPTTANGAPPPDPNSQREAFVKEGSASCLKKLESSPEIMKALSRETLVNYCSCYMNALADLAKDGTTIPTEKVEKTASACWDDQGGTHDYPSLSKLRRGPQYSALLV
jgi:hypothetical protein